MTLRWAGVLALTVTAAAGCGEPVSGTVRVGAAASLEGAFTALAASLAASAPEQTVEFTFAGTPTILTQIREGAPIDVFASADADSMHAAAAAGLIDGSPVVFARNTMEIAVTPGNPRGVTGPADLADAGLTVVLAAPEVPAGRYARQVLDAAGVPIPAAAFEASVAAVVARVALGEADAGIVYRTDIVAASPAVEGIEIPAALNVEAVYYAGVVAGSRAPNAGRAFVEFLSSEEGQRVLADAGFAAP